MLNIVAVIMALTAPYRGYAAQKAPDLVVSLRDENDAAVRATIIVRDSAGQHQLARADTDTQGLAVFGDLPLSEVRVAAEGNLPNGARLFQRGDDARGIYFLLGAGSARLDLRIDADGAVVPDPATMFAQEGAGGQLAELPTARVAGQEIAPAARPAHTPPFAQAALPQPAPAAAQRPGNGGLSLGGIALIAALGLGIAGVLALRRSV